MIAADLLSYGASAVVAFWVVHGTTEVSMPVVACAAAVAAVAIPIHWVFGLYASIVRYIGLTLIWAGLKATFVVTSITMMVCVAAEFMSAPIRAGIVFWEFFLILVVGGRLIARLFLGRSNASREPIIILWRRDRGRPIGRLA